MPTYEYECLKCGETFDAFQKMSDEVLKKCPQCKGEVRRLIGAGCGLIFKGSGFYITDYKKKNSSGTIHSTENKTKEVKQPAACTSCTQNCANANSER